MDAIRNNKKLRAIVIAVGVVLLLLALNAVANKVSYPYVKARAVTYLSHKYDAKRSEFELVDYQHAGTYWDSSRDEFFQFLAWRDFSFEFEYNDRRFFVNRFRGKFCDDYQLEDMEIWCTQWLQENIDKNIIGINLNILFVNRYYDNVGKKYSEQIQKDDVFDMMNNPDFHVWVYCKSEDNSNISTEELTDKLNKRLNSSKSIRVDDSKYRVTRRDYKSDMTNWAYGFDNNSEQKIQ